MKYVDVLLDCPNGLGQVVQEFIDKGLTRFVVFDDEGQPVRIANGVNRTFTAARNDWVSPCLIRMKVHEDVYQLLKEADFKKVEILADCFPGETDPETGERLDVYAKVKKDPEKLARYLERYCEPDTILDGDGNEIPNPKAGEFKAFGRWA